MKTIMMILKSQLTPKIPPRKAISNTRSTAPIAAKPFGLLIMLIKVFIKFA